MRYFKTAGHLMGLACVLAGAAGAVPVRVKEPAFSFAAPEGFKEVIASNANPDVVRLFVRPTADGGEPETWLTVKKQKFLRYSAMSELRSV